MALLRLNDVHTYYGAIHALKGISIEVDEGEIVTLIGEPIHERPAHQIVMRGVAQAPEGRRVFGRLTVTENLEMGAYARTDGKAVRQDIDYVFQLFPRLGERSKQVAGTLSGGEQQMLSIGRALMARPRLLLLDEPSMGLAPILVETIFETVREINTQGTTILLVEQNARMALSLASRGYVLETGEIALANRAEDLLQDDMVRKVYLGED
jgi:branched-chain amino acid transport system ATP-binding protein